MSQSLEEIELIIVDDWIERDACKKLYKCTVLCGAGLLYGILPLYGSEKELCKKCLEKINKIMPELYWGQYQNVQKDMRKQVEQNWKHHRCYLLKLAIHKILQKR